MIFSLILVSFRQTRMKLLVWILLFIVHIRCIRTLNVSLASFDDQVTVLLNQMTDEEKVGQMTQVTINLILKDATKPWNEIEVDSEKLATALQQYKIGSILNVAETGAIGINQWQDIIGKIQDESNKTRLRIPVLYGIDSIHGANYIQNAVLFPQAIALAATFNPALAGELGKIVAHQTRAAGIPWSFHPQIDIGYVFSYESLSIIISA
jgi:beta-glucosidase